MNKDIQNKIDRIKRFIIYRDLQCMFADQQVSPQTVHALFELRNLFAGVKGQDILKLLDEVIKELDDGPKTDINRT